LQVLDDGMLTDGLGRKIDFKNTMIIMTSNVGIKKKDERTTGYFGSSEEDDKSILEMALKNIFAPEFLNRIDDVVIFNSLSKDDIVKIVDISLKDVLARVKGIGYEVVLTNEAKLFLADKGYDPKFGARPLHRAIQKYLEDPLAQKILDAEVSEESVLWVTTGDEELQIIVKTAEEIAETSEESDDKA